MSSSRGRQISDPEDEEMEFAPSFSKRLKYSNEEEIEETQVVSEPEDQAMVVDDDG